MIIYLILCLITLVLSKKTEIVVILGCNDNSIQKERVQSAIKYIKQSKLKKIIYLTGGIKNNEIYDESEASRMNKIFKKEKIKSEIIIDDKSKNTAQNLINLKKWIKYYPNDEIISYVIVTSDFHKDRVYSIFKKIFNTDNVKFVLSKSLCNECWKNEEIHKKNMYADIMEALIHIN